MKTIIALIVAAALAGCASLENAGHASYEAKPFAGPDGTLVCCSLTIKDGKEFAGRQIQFQTNGGAYGFTIMEGPSKAFKGQGIAAKAATVLPVTGLQELVGPDK